MSEEAKKQWPDDEDYLAKIKVINKIQEIWSNPNKRKAREKIKGIAADILTSAAVVESEESTKEEVAESIHELAGLSLRFLTEYAAELQQFPRAQ